MKKITFNIAVLITLLLTATVAFAQVTTITSFAPTSGSVGTTVTITGTNFDTSFGNNIVFFGATQATVSAGSATSLTVTVPTGASYQPITVTNVITGLTAYSAQPFIVTFPCGGVIDAASFAPKMDISQGGSPMCVSIGDLDGDGKTDLAVANYNNTVSVYRNTGNIGTISFATSMNYTTGTHPYSVLTGDLDGDGKLDLVVANYNSNTVSVFRNTGSSGTISFAAKVDFTTGTNPRSVSTGDFDRDGKTDLAVTNYNSNTVSLLRNTGSSGTISFAAKVDISTAVNPMSVSTGDLDGDGKPDLAVAHEGSNMLSVFRNTSSSGTISFATSVNLSTWAYPIGISIADLDGDGKLDLANVNAGPGTVTVFRNTGSSGTISFAAPVISAAGTTPNSISTSDFNGDGKLDLVVANSGSNNASVFGNTGSSGTISFATKVDFAADVSSRSVSTADFDGDGKPDLAVANASSSNVSVFRNSIAGLPPIVTANATATTLCAGTSVTLTGGGTANTYAWSGGVANGVGFIPPTGTTSYTVTGTAVCQSTDTITITVNPLPIVTITASADTVCSGESVTLTFSGANTYFPPSDGIPFVPQMTNTYTFVGTDINGCTDTLTKEIFVNYLPSISVSATNITCTGCNDGAAMSYGYGGLPPYSYYWSNTAITQNINNLSAGNYLLQVTDANSCSDTTSVNIAEYVEPPPPVGQIISAGGAHSLFLCSNNTVMACGDNLFGGLGNGTPNNSNSPVYVSAMSGVKLIEGGGGFSFFLKNDGTVWACGENNLGQLGDGTTIYKTVPVQIPSLTGITTISSGVQHTLFLKNDGTVWVTGDNSNGEFGIGTYSGTSTPLQISSLTGITSISAGSAFSLFLKSDGTVWACGHNSHGELGDGTITEKTTPVQVNSLTGITAISAGGHHSLFMKNDGTVWTAGDNDRGALGNGTLIDASTPIQISSLEGIASFSAGNEWSLFLKNDGTVWASGRNDHGQLGDGTTTDRATPAQVGSLSGITATKTGGGHSLFIKNDGTVWSCGWNWAGQVGDGTNLTDRTTPVQVTGLCSIGVGIENNSIENSISVYPNPSSGILNIELSDAIETELIIYNAIGQKVFTTQTHQTHTNIDLNKLMDGFYSLHLKNENGVTIKKVILKK